MWSDRLGAEGQGSSGAPCCPSSVRQAAGKGERGGSHPPPRCSLWPAGLGSSSPGPVIWMYELSAALG